MQVQQMSPYVAPRQAVHPAYGGVVQVDPRQRTSSFGSQPPRPQPQQYTFNKANYVPAHVKDDPTPPPPRDILSWQLVDFDTRRTRGFPALWFDTSQDPRREGREILVWSPGEPDKRPISRDEVRQLVSASSWKGQMVLYVDKLPMWWPIVARNREGVRCVDVFRAIYDTLAEPLTMAEIEDVGADYIERCEPWFRSRCQQDPRGARQAERHRICRVDLLRGRKYFKGLTPHPKKRDTWLVHLEDYRPSNEMQR